MSIEFQKLPFNVAQCAFHRSHFTWYNTGALFGKPPMRAAAWSVIASALAGSTPAIQTWQVETTRVAAARRKYDLWLGMSS